MTYLDATRITQAYGQILGDLGEQIADETWLPHPKAVIKQALLLMLRFAATDQIRSSLKLSYLYLAHFQPGVGEEVVHAPAMLKEPVLTSEQFTTFTTQMNQWISSLTRSSAERDQLQTELDSAGFKD